MILKAATGTSINEMVLLECLLSRQDGFNVKSDAFLVAAAKFGLLASNDPLALNLDDLKL
jgi:hypothetical protein